MRELLLGNDKDSPLSFHVDVCFSHFEQVITYCLFLIVSIEGLSSGIRCKRWQYLLDEWARKMEFDSYTLLKAILRVKLYMSPGMTSLVPISCAKPTLHQQTVFRRCLLVKWPDRTRYILCLARINPFSICRPEPWK